MPDIRDKWGQTPLHYCISVQFIDTAQVFIEHSGPQFVDIINNQDRFGKSALHAAAETANSEAVELLLQHGADVNICNVSGATPLMVCAENCGRNRSVRPMELLIKAGALIDLKDFRPKRSALQVCYYVMYRIFEINN